MFTEEDLLPLSGLQHLAFCERQWALIHLEQIWMENRLTADGRVMHERVHQTESEGRPGMRVVRGLRLHSFRLGLSGQADVVEYHRTEETGIALPGRQGLWSAFPVEYKRGKPKADACDEVQLCAQGLCLEEMYGSAVSGGALYYGEPRRRTEVAFSKELRAQTELLAGRMHALYASRSTPRADWQKKCESCSLRDVCLPKLGSKSPRVSEYMAAAMREIGG
ncbi:MAG: CRISPR-associated protein Cas4 [Bryobacterales bacterium]|nr:CRISPR-associated protein Cas4 [Bryobacterales bacterium]